MARCKYPFRLHSNAHGEGIPTGSVSEFWHVPFPKTTLLRNYGSEDRITAQWMRGEITAVGAMERLGMTPSTFYRKVRKNNLQF